MRNTPPPVPIHDRDANVLLEDLCIALRNVGVWDSDIPKGETVQEHIATVCAIKRELDQRGIATDKRVTRLSAETNWRMPDLLQDCLAFPEHTPYVKEADGIRRYLRCRLCRKRERPPDAQLFWWCNQCFARVLEAVNDLTPVDGIVLFRTYNSEAWCPHANSETVLVTEYYLDSFHGNCAKCLAEELARRDVTHSATLPPMD